MRNNGSVPDGRTKIRRDRQLRLAVSDVGDKSIIVAKSARRRNFYVFQNLGKFIHSCRQLLQRQTLLNNWHNHLQRRNNRVASCC